MRKYISSVILARLQIFEKHDKQKVHLFSSLQPNSIDFTNSILYPEGLDRVDFISHFQLDKMAKTSRRSQYRSRKQPVTQEKPIQFNKKYLAGTVSVIVLMLALSFYQTKRMASSILDVPKKREPPTFLGMEIPKEVLQRMYLAESQPDKFEILREWAISEGVVFQARKDGSYVAIKDDQELVLKEPDPELANQNDYQNIDQEDDFMPESQHTEPLISQEQPQNNTDDFSE